MSEVEAPCEKTGMPCCWECEEEYGEHGALAAWDLFCPDCGRYRDWSKDEMESGEEAKEMTINEALEEVLEHVEEWSFDDNPRERNRCLSCGWDSTKDRGPKVLGLSHKPGCKLRAALDVVHAFLAASRKA